MANKILRFGFRLSTPYSVALETLAQLEGLSQAATLRRLIKKAAGDNGIPLTASPPSQVTRERVHFESNLRGAN